MTEAEKALHDVLFEIFSAGFEFGLAGKKDLKSAYDEYYNAALKDAVKNLVKGV
jgi:hypothetical protein